MDDLISRQAAIEAFRDTVDLMPECYARDIIADLPSAQPDPCDVCDHKDDCGDMRIYCPAERRTDDGE